MWVSGYPVGCLWCEAPAHLLEKTSEWWDREDRIYVGVVLCKQCFERSRYTRRPEKKPKQGKLFSAESAAQNITG